MESSEKHYVYIHSFSDGSIYVGKGMGDRAYRMSKSKRSVLWMRTAKKYGMPEVSFLKDGVCEELALFIEAEAIESFKAKGFKLRNIAAGGHAPQAGMVGPLSPNFGRKHTKERIRQLSAENSGAGNPHYGKRHSESAKIAIGNNTRKNWQENHEKMRLINQGRKLTDEHKEKISKASKAMSKESREKIRAKLTGKKRTPEQLENYRKAGERRIGKAMPDSAKKKMSDSQWRKDKRIYELSGPDGQSFKGMRSDFSKEYGFSVNDLFRADKKRRPHVKGWRLTGGIK